MTPAQLEAEQLVAHLAGIFDAPAAIAWEPGLAAGRRIVGYCTAAEPEALHIDPAQPPLDLLAIAAHEFLHSLEYRGIVAMDHRRKPTGSLCSELAERVGPEIAALAIASPTGAPTRVELATLLFKRLGIIPRPLLATVGTAR